MVNSLVFIIFVLALIQPTKNRAYAGLCVAIPTALHCLFAPDDNYYHYAALTDGLIIILLASLVTLDGFVKRLLMASVAFFFVNVLGYVLFMLLSPPALYDDLSVALYTVIIVLLLKKEQGNERINDVADWNWRFFTHWRTNLFYHQKSLKEQ